MPGGPGVRWDGGVEVGDEVTLHYDSMLAKLIVWAPDRAQAIARMHRALDELAVLGVATNQAFHRRLLADRAFQDGELDIQFLDRRPDLARPAPSEDDMLKLAVAAALAEDEARRLRRPAVARDEHANDAWSRVARLEGLRRETDNERDPDSAPRGRRRRRRAARRRAHRVRAAHRAGRLVEPGALRSHKRFARARPGRLVERSPDRVEPRCPTTCTTSAADVSCSTSRPARSARLGAASWATRSGGWPSAKWPTLRSSRPTVSSTTGPRSPSPSAPTDAASACIATTGPSRSSISTGATSRCRRSWRCGRRSGGCRALLPPRLSTLVLRSDRTGRCHVLFHVAGAEAWGGARALAAEFTRAGAGRDDLVAGGGRRRRGR